MKKVLFILMLVLASMDVSAQAKPNYYGTHDPSSDSLLTNCHVDIINDHFYIVYIDTIEGKKQEELLQSHGLILTSNIHHKLSLGKFHHLR